MDKEENPQAPQVVAGVFLEKSKEKWTIFQATKKRLLRPGTGLALLEAQAATGGIIDPFKNQTLSVEEAVKAGIVGLSMKEKLLAAEMAANGYTDPYTNQTLSVFQAMQKDLIPKHQAVKLLEAQLCTGGIIDPVNKKRIPVELACEMGYFEKDLLSDNTKATRVFYDPDVEGEVSYKDLRDRCTKDPETGLLLLQVFITFKGLRRGVSSTKLLASNIIDKETYDDLQKGKTTVQDLMLHEKVKESLEGTGSIAGVAVLSTNQKMSIYKALKQGILMPGTALILLEAQAATGYITDPVQNKRYTVDDAVKNKLIGPELHAKLLSAERAVTGYTDPYTKGTISLFQALSKDLIVKDHGIRLLEAQIATGGIIDPINSHRLPVDVAYKRGYFDEDLNDILKDPGDDTKGFFDPNTKENLTYLQLIERCVIDPATGLILLPLQRRSGGSHVFIDVQTKSAFKQVKVPVTYGRYAGMTVSLWELLMSEHCDIQQRVEIIQKYYSGSLALSALATKVLEIIEYSVKNQSVEFEGLREKVTPQQLVEADIINKNVLEQLRKGKVNMSDVAEEESVKVYLQGTGSIAGILLDDQQKMSIYQAGRQGKLMPGTALVLLEAQAATGYIIDPIENTKFSVDGALKAKVIGTEFQAKLLSAEKAVTGYTDPYTGKKISLFQAMGKDLIVKEHGIRLLEAQIATGGIIDPINSHRIPVHVAYQREYFDEKMNQILSDPTDDTKGFFDPNTKENLTYLQLMDRCVTDPTTGLCLLPLKSKGSKVNVHNQMKKRFQDSRLTVKYGRFSERSVTLWEIINSEYLSETKRQELFSMFMSKTITIEEITTIILDIIEKQEVKKNLNFEGLRGKVSVLDLLNLKIIDEKNYHGLVEGKLTLKDISEIDAVRISLRGKGSVAGIILQPSNQKISIYEAQRKGILTPGTVLNLLEAQAATGFIIDPHNNKMLTVDEALKEKVIGPEIYEKLLTAEKAVTGYKDPYTGEIISLFQAMNKELIVRQHGIRLLEAQIATGGIIDPLKCIHLPLEVAYKQKYFDAEMNKILIDPSDDTKGFFDPNTQNNLTYKEILQNCIKDADTGLYFLSILDKNRETDKSNFHGLRKDVTADELLKSKIIDKTMYDDLNTGKVTVDYVSKMDSVSKYLQGTNCIAGVFIESTKQTMSIYQAKTKGLLTPGTSLVLLEAQAATGYVIDPVKNEKLSVEEAVTLGVVGSELRSKLLSAERAVTGYTDPYTEKTISLFQALKKDLIVKDHGIRLLEAQIATGGIIDPVHSHRVPVEVAFQRGYFDEEMNQILADPGDDTKGFFDPNTKENLTYLQLLERTVKDPNTGLSLLVIVSKGEFYFFVDEKTKAVLKSTTTSRAGGKFQGKVVSLWDLLYSDYISDEKRRDLVQQYKSGSITIERFMEIILTIISEKTTTSASDVIAQQKSQNHTSQSKTTITTVTETTETTHFHGLRKDVTADELLKSKIIDKTLYDDLNAGKVTVDHVSQMESVRKYLQGTNCIAGVFVQSTKQIMSIYEAKVKGLLTPGTSLVLLEAQAATGFMIDPVKNRKLSVEEAVASGVVSSDLKAKLLSAERAVTGYTDPYTEKTISLFQALKKDLIVKDHGIRLLEAQIATGGIIDPVHSHRVPVEVAFQRGYFDEEMNQILADPGDDTKGFFDPNTKENLTYLQLLERTVKDPNTGLSLLVIVSKGEFYFFVDEKTKAVLKSTTTSRAGGKFQGKVVSLWDLLYSDYISDEKRRDLVQQYKSGSITIERFMEIILTIISEKTTTSASDVIAQQKSQNHTSQSKTTITTVTETTETTHFHGLRKDVTADELLKSKIIDKTLYDDLNAGKVTVDHVSQMESVRKYLQGTNCIAGVFVQSTKQIMSIYEAKVKGLLTPGTSLVLLEAQAATGFMIDPVKNRKLSVEEAVASGVVSSDLKAKLLSAERAVTGYTDPYTEKTISLFQALKKDLIVKDHGIRLLEAQIATGGIIDPVHSHRVPVEVAFQRGYFDEEMNQILADPGDDTKGFFDPNTKENLTYLQLLERTVKDPNTGLSLLVIVSKGEFYFFVDEKTKAVLKSTTTSRAGGKFQGKVASLWDLLYSDYISDEKRRDLVQQYKSGSITIERFMEIILTIISEKTTTSASDVIAQQKSQNHTSQSKTTITTVTETTETTHFHGLRKDVTADELLKSKIIDKTLYDDLNAGKVTVDHVSQMESVRKYLQGTNCIAGVFVQSTKQIMSIYEAKVKGLLTPGTSLVLLEAQAATGFMIDPVKNRKLSVEEAVASGVVSSDLKAKLLSAERAVTGYTDPYTEKTISLFQALKKDLIVKDHGIRLLEAQIATGGIIDPVHSHRVPVEVAFQRGYFDEEMNQILADPGDDTKGFFDPNTKENLTYLQLLERTVKDPNTGLSLLVIVSKGEFYFFVDEKTKAVLKSTTTSRAGGKFQGKVASLWDLLYSDYISDEKRRDLVQQYKSGSITIERFMEIILTIISEKTTTSASDVIAQQKSQNHTSQSKTTITTVTETTETTHFHGLRKDVTADELLKSKIIDKTLYDDLNAGKVTVDHVSQMESVRKYLQGTNCIAGVFVQSTKQIMSIYEAKVKGLLTPGTSLVLLEAQAATGFMIDPVKNRKLSVEEAVASGVVSSDLKAKLLSAERAVTGYTDPYTEKTISLFQALKKDLIVKDHGIRLLEAQIATGGIIDPVHSHRVPVEVAFQRGYFDEEMNQILADPGDDTKGFFDPNTKENLTYLQLLERTVKDPNTGLSLLVIVSKGEFYFFVDEKTKAVLKSTTTSRAGGKFQGKVASLWDLLYSDYISDEKRRDLVQQYKSGSITIERFMEIILTIISEKTTTSASDVIAQQKSQNHTSQSKTTITTVTETTETTHFHGLRKDVTADELLKSKIIDKTLYDDLNAGKVTVDHVSQMESVRKYLQGTNCIAGVFVQSTKQIMSIYEAKVKGLLTPGTSLVLLEAQAATGFMIDPVKNRKLSVEEAVASGVVSSDLKAKLLSAERAVTGYTDPYTEKTISLFQALKKDLIVKDHGIRLLEAQIATGGIIDPVHSHRVPVEVAFQRGYFDEEMNQILADPGDDTKGFFDPNTKENLTYLQLLERTVKDPNTGLSLLVIVSKGEFYFFVDEKTKAVLKSTTTSRAGGKFQGKVASLWDLLYSDYISDEKRRDLVQQYKSGSITIERFMEIILTIISEKTTTSASDVIAQQKSQNHTSQSKTTITTVTETTETTHFHGLRKDVTADELLKSKIIDKTLYDDLNAGKVTVDHVSQMESVRKYLQGTNCIAGVFVQSTKQIMSIYEAKVKGLLTPGTSLVLLEAQAATGFMIDPVKNRKLSVEEAVASGVVSSDLKAKLLSAERAVTGYTDPYTEKTISLFQALKKDLIVKDHGIRLLEAQIATGGIIDPVHSHRVPVEVAFQRGYFDEEINQILADPGDDTKGFFDPNTKENLTYLQLLERTVKDPNTGLSLLVIVSKGEFYFFVDEKTKAVLKSTTTSRAGGKFQGKVASLWDLLYSDYISDEKRRELVQQYKSCDTKVTDLTEKMLSMIK